MTARTSAAAAMVTAAVVVASSGGCAAQRIRADLAAQTGGNAALFEQFHAYDAGGSRLSFADIVARCRAADVIFWGEQHGESVCNSLEAQLFASLLADGRPVALAMEFFEADTQAELDAYLRGERNEADFRKASRQGRDYALAHRPLIELCRSYRVPVLAANAPRRLLRSFRGSPEEYPEFIASAPDEQRRYLPRELRYVDGPYRDRFRAAMRDHAPPPATQPAAGEHPSDMLETMYLSQLLWDNAMAEAIADHREAHAASPVMLVVGGFHVRNDGGTYAIFRRLRPRDRVCTIAYERREDANLSFREEDRGAADIVIYGVSPPPRPATAETSGAGPAASQPASGETRRL